MEVWAAIDLYQGRVVTPVRGRPELGTTVTGDPLAIAERWQREGASGLHIVDLDAALQNGSNGAITESIIRGAKLPVQVAGGVRTATHVHRWLEVGASRIVLGTLAYEEPSKLGQLLTSFGAKRIVVAADYRKGTVVTRGWTKKESLTITEAVKRLENLGVKTVLSTAVQLDGTNRGPDIPTLKRIRRSTKMHILASGGIRNSHDIKELQRIGVDGIVAGRALYEGSIRLSELKRVVVK